MTSIEPGIYRIVNVGKGTAITVPAENTNTIVGWQTPNQSGQQWVIRCSGGKYNISDWAHGRHIAVDNAKHGTRASLGVYPTFWELIPLDGATWNIKLLEYNLLVDMDVSGNGSEIKLRQQGNSLDSKWKFERLGDLPDDGPKQTQSGTGEKDRIIAQMAEQLAQQSKQLVELTSQLAEQNRKIIDQEREIYVQKRQLEEKDQQLEQANREVKYMLGRATREEGPLSQDRMAGTGNSSAGGAGRGEDTSLRDEVERLKSRINQLIHPFTI